MQLVAKNEVKKVQKKVLENRQTGKEDWYEGLSFEEVSTLYNHARSGYFVKSMGRFVYPDAQSNMHYIRCKLLLKYLNMIKERQGIEAASKIYENMRCCGWNTFDTLHGEEIFCMGENLLAIKKLERGIWPENAKSLWK